MLALLAMSAASLSAQVTNVATNVVTMGPVPLPTTALDYWDLAIGAVSPIVVWGLSKIVPKIPRAFLPALTPAVGILLGAIINWLSQQNMSWFEAAKAGSMAVFFREVTNQWVTKRMLTPDHEPPAPAVPAVPAEPPVPPAPPNDESSI